MDQLLVERRLLTAFGYQQAPSHVGRGGLLGPGMCPTYTSHIANLNLLQGFIVKLFHPWISLQETTLNYTFSDDI